MFDEEDENKPTMIRPSDQSDMWDLARYVEEHPDDYEERWRLAKKMYLSWEYRHALDHLSVLKEEWTPRLNVLRYLAATYYRLGRYDDAVRELEQALARWPEELGLREQLARVKEIAGDRVGASKVWESIAKLSPEHPTANSAIKRLHSVPSNTPKEDLGLMDSDSGVPLRVGVVCPQCGAQNSSDESRCWQCNEPLAVSTPAPRRRDALTSNTVAAGPSIESLVSIIGFVAFIIICFCLFLSVRLILEGHSPEEAAGYTSLQDLYQKGMGRTRLALGAALLFGWPLALWVSLSFLNVRLRVPPVLVSLVAVLVGSIAYLCTWLPANAMYLFVVLPPGTAALFIYGLFRLPARQSTAIWAMHLGIMAVTIPMVVLVAERVQLGVTYNPLTELTRVLAFANAPAASEGVTHLQDTAVPVKQRVRWESTGSSWLDVRAGGVLFTVTSSNSEGLVFEIKEEDGEVKLYKDVTSTVWSTVYRVEPNRTYEVNLVDRRRKEGAVAEVEIDGLMRPAFIP